MLVVAATFTTDILLWAQSHLTQLLFHTAWERMTDEYPPSLYSNLSRKHGVPETTRIVQDRSRPVEAMEVVKSKK